MRTLLVGATAVGCLGASLLAGAVGNDGIVVLAYNDLGMHCMNDEFSEFMILPPFNTVRAQVLERKDDPEILESSQDVVVRWSVPGNAHSADKTNFWTHAMALLGASLPSDVGLTGTGLSGDMQKHPGQRFWEAVGIPISPWRDDGRLDPYPLATIEATYKGAQTASTVTVVPVSSELACNLCHGGGGVSVGDDLLQKHDALHGTNLASQKPVLCASCHADNALALPGTPGVSQLSHAIHGAHADNVAGVPYANECYACHPGGRTKCQRDIHFAKGITCTACHGDMLAVANPAREPWVDEPLCGSCHQRPGFEFEEPGKLFKDSRGHGGVLCGVCHGSPHAITPTVTEADNQQAILHQGYAGVLDNCLVCHKKMPGEPFFHEIED